MDRGNLLTIPRYTASIHWKTAFQVKFPVLLGR